MYVYICIYIYILYLTYTYIYIYTVVRFPQFYHPGNRPGRCIIHHTDRGRASLRRLGKQWRADLQKVVVYRW